MEMFVNLHHFLFEKINNERQSVVLLGIDVLNRIVCSISFLFSLTADVQQRALLPPSAALANQSQQLQNQDQSSDEDIFDDTDTDEENTKKQLQMSIKKILKTKPISKSITDESNNSIIQTKRLLSSIFPTTNDVYGFHLEEPSPESLHCYEQYAKMAREGCLLPTSSPTSVQKQHLANLPSVSSTTSFEM